MAIYALTYVWMVFMTFYYFIPDIQLVLNKHYSASLIQELMANDGLLRGLPGLPMALLPAWMFIKLGIKKCMKRLVTNYRPHYRTSKDISKGVQEVQVTQFMEEYSVVADTIRHYYKRIR